VSGVKRTVMYLSKLLFKSNEKTFSLGGVKELVGQQSSRKTSAVRCPVGELGWIEILQHVQLF